MTYPIRRPLLRQQVDDYVNELTTVSKACLASTRSTKLFEEVYSTSLSADVVLDQLDERSLRPHLGSARTIVLRVPMLVSLGQSSLGKVEMRRLVELTLWTVYFTDHPVEWARFGLGSGAGFSRNPRQPISYAARRELAHYFEYALELMESEPSGLGKYAVCQMKQLTRGLNASVHAGGLAQATSRMPPYDKVSDSMLKRFHRLQKNLFANCCLLLAAYRRPRFDRFDATARAHFDWLVGSKVRKAVRKGPFGLP